MPTYRSFEYTHNDELPPGHTNEVRTPAALVEEYLTTYSDPGDTVLDIFAGYGTTLCVAERLDRVPFGVELESDRVAYIREHLDTPDHVRQGDVLELDASWFPACECCFTSPPFMEQSDTRNPFQNYAGESTYADYLDDIEAAFDRLGAVVGSGGHVLIDIVNMTYEGRVTPLAWDVADRVSNVFHFVGEDVITWQSDDRTDHNGTYGYGYDHSYVLVFQQTGA
ncbi:DNA methylase N-4/N-6 domain-containing protein [Halovivax asiaticus JCM 14624]|uniref:Type II methyltransferase n=1 Tax=Halovivax asiaticus JCM 14624 TaxID=1227490 RepID=M0BS22_9EURY|nr:DNA methyltransferase [Halovivax asiaticus]ELZ13740.1 DNA methylase N-4/N-6 domain-containing protein [Halovivax asiaticus JCM 14624]